MKFYKLIIIIFICLIFYIFNFINFKYIIEKDTNTDGLFQEMTLGNFEKKLGLAQHINESTVENFFYYWENKGLAVLCHPLYCRQAETKDSANWEITSFFVPVQKTITVQAYSNMPQMEFKKIIPFNFYLYNFLRYGKYNYYKDSTLQYIEFNKRDWLLEYD